MRTRILYVRIKYSMYDLICDVISCCVWCCDVGDKIVMQNKKKEKINWRNVYLILHLKVDFGMVFTAC